nr:hypothetical protein [Leisingera sp.]
MERSQVLDAMGQLKLYGMKTAYDEIIAAAVIQENLLARTACAI